MQTSTAALWSVTVPTEPVLQANYPDPTHSLTAISFTVPEAISVTLTLFKRNGEKITVPADRYVQTGDHRMEVDVSTLNLPAGVYLLHLQAGATTRTEAVTVVQ